MKYLIIYFSGTGNTELLVHEIKKRLENKEHTVETYSIEEVDQIKKLNLKDKIIGFAYPVYKFTYPDNFKSLFSYFNQMAQNNKYFLFTTYTRFNAFALSDFVSKLDKNKYSLIAYDSFKAPSCGISCRQSIDDYEYESVMFFENGINKRIDFFVDQILRNEAVERPKVSNKLTSTIQKKIVKDIESVKYPKLNINENFCNVCGLCAKACPEHNLIKKGGIIKIVDDKTCLHCLRCMNHCPQNAIDFGQLTLGDHQYTLKIRDRLFNQSISGYEEAYWNSFDEVVKLWRRNTIKYYFSKKFLKIKDR